MKKTNKKEHILVCLSSAPSNAKIIETAAKMAKAFGADFTALYVETPSAELMLDADKARLGENIALAKNLGAVIATVFGDDVAKQIAEFSRLSGVTKVVMGRSVTGKKHLFRKPTLTEQLISLAPSLDIHIIPDTSVKQTEQKKRFFSKRTLTQALRDMGISGAVLMIATALGFLFDGIGFTDANIITVYILGVLFTSILTDSRVCWIISSTVGVLLFNFFFAEPEFSFRAYEVGYPITFLIMLIASLVTGSLATKLKHSAKQSSKAAYRTQILLDTNQMLAGAKSREDIFDIIKEQSEKLTGQRVCIFTEKPKVVETEDDKAHSRAFDALSQAGCGTKLCPEARSSYYPIHVNDKMFGVLSVSADKPIGAFTNGILLSIIGECALALESEQNAREKEEATLFAEHEKLRANLLRTISHDLRTPLTSISGNAGNLLANESAFDEDTRRQIYSDIYEDSRWLTNTVENLLSVTRIEEGRARLSLSAELVCDVIEEAVKHIGRNRGNRIITVRLGDELMLGMMDARLIVQVIINLVDNAVKYTPDGSEIEICAEAREETVAISVSDNGDGVPDDAKERVFDMFYTGASQIADSRRSLGLGLALCKSIVNAHGGEITVKDNQPHGAVFTFTLHKGNVQIYE